MALPGGQIRGLARPPLPRASRNTQLSLPAPFSSGKAPIQDPLCLANVWSVLPWIVFAKLPMDDLRSGAGEIQNRSCEFEDGELFRIPEIYRAGNIARAVHHFEQTDDQVVDVAEGSCCRPSPKTVMS